MPRSLTAACSSSSSAPTDGVSHFGTPFTTGRRLANRGVDGGLTFEFGIDLGADQNDHRGYPDPRHEADRGAEGSVGLVVAAEVRRVPGKEQRSRNPSHCGKNAAGRNPSPLRLIAARAETIDHS